MNEIGRKLYLLRVLHNLTQHYMAEQLNVSSSTYVSMESGITNMHCNRLGSILSIYNLSPAQFFAFSEDDILNVVRGNSVVVPNAEPTIYPRIIAKLESLNLLLFQILEMKFDLQKHGIRQLAPPRK